MSQSNTTAQSHGLCPNCGTEGPLGGQCGEKVCQRRGYHCIPSKYASRQLERDTRVVDPLIGSRIGDYAVVDTIGVGGFGRVYLALQMPIRRRPLKVALKVIDFGDDASPETVALMLQKFESEADALASLTHPNIVRLMKYGQHDTHPFIVMEFVSSGRTLHAEILKRVQARRGFLLDDAVHIMGQVVNGIQEAHDQDIVHRDIKPDNIMLQEVAGDANFVRLLDFGLAKFVDERSNTSLAIGTPMYMAPEQLDRSNIGPWTDVYAMGVMAFELFTGRRAFQGEFQDIYQQKMDHAYDPLWRVPDKQITAPTADFFRRSMTVNPDERYQSCSQFRVALDRAAAAQHRHGEQTIDLTYLIDEDLRPRPTSQTDPEGVTDTHEHRGLAVGDTHAPAVGMMNTIQAGAGAVLAAQAQNAQSAGMDATADVSSRPIRGAYAEAVAESADLASKEQHPKQVNEPSAELAQPPSSADTMRPGFNRTGSPGPPSGKITAIDEDDRAFDEAAYGQAGKGRSLLRGLSLVFVLLAIGLLAAVYMMGRNDQVLTSVQVFGGPAAAPGQPLVMRMSGHSSDGKRDLPVEVASVTLNGEKASFELSGASPSYVTVAVPNNLSGDVKVDIAARCNGADKALAATVGVNAPKPGASRPALADYIERHLQAGAEQYLTMLPDHQVLVREMSNRVFVRARDMHGFPIPDVRVTVGNHVLFADRGLQVTGTTDANGLFAFDAGNVGRPMYNFKLTATKGAATYELETQLITNTRQMQLSIDPPVTLPSHRPNITLQTWESDAHGYCELVHQDVVIWATYVKTKNGLAELRPNALPAGRYDLQCYDHPASPSSAYATVPVIVADGSPLEAVIKEVKRYKLPAGAHVEPPDDTNPRLTIDYWLAVLRRDLTPPRLVLDTREADEATFNEVKRVRQTRVLTALGVVVLLFLLWLADGILKTVIATRERLREFDDQDAPSPSRLIRLRGLLLIIVLVGASVASVLGVVWLMLNVN